MFSYIETQLRSTFSQRLFIIIYYKIYCKNRLNQN